MHSPTPYQKIVNNQHLVATWKCRGVTTSYSIDPNPVDACFIHNTIKNSILSFRKKLSDAPCAPTRNHQGARYIAKETTQTKHLNLKQRPLNPPKIKLQTLTSNLRGSFQSIPRLSESLQPYNLNNSLPIVHTQLAKPIVNITIRMGAKRVILQLPTSGVLRHWSINKRNELLLQTEHSSVDPFSSLEAKLGPAFEGLFAEFVSVPEGIAWRTTVVLRLDAAGVEVTGVRGWVDGFLTLGTGFWGLGLVWSEWFVTSRTLVLEY